MELRNLHVCRECYAECKANVHTETVMLPVSIFRSVEGFDVCASDFVAGYSCAFLKRGCRDNNYQPACAITDMPLDRLPSPDGTPLRGLPIPHTTCPMNKYR